MIQSQTFFKGIHFIEKSGYTFSLSSSKCKTLSIHIFVSAIWYKNFIIPPCFPKTDSCHIWIFTIVIIKLTLTSYLVPLHPNYMLEMISFLKHVTTVDFTSLETWEPIFKLNLAEINTQFHIWRVPLRVATPCLSRSGSEGHSKMQLSVSSLLICTRLK